MINNVTVNSGSFRPFPAYTDRAAWSSLPETVRNYYLSEAAKLKGQKWPSLPATAYLEFYRDGNRSHYEGLYFGRRTDLFTLTIAECIAGKGEFLDDIINAVWLIAEETTWVVPAHLNHGRPSKGSFYHRPGTAEKTNYPEPRRLHDPEDDVYIDLFAAETGALLSWVYYFLGDTIAALVPELKRRIEEELSRRILTPFMEQDYFPWMGLAHDNPVNNWNPWINSNVLVAFLVFATVFPSAAEGVNKSIRSINRFIHFYADDGGCDEGPSYFGAAGASLLDFIEELGQVSDVSYLYRTPKIQNIVSYIYKVYIGGEYFVNYADAPPRVFTDTGLLERAGKIMGNDTLVSFTSYLRAHKWCRDDALTDRTFRTFRCLKSIFASPVTSNDNAFKAPAVSWFPGIQVLCARDDEFPKGFFFSAKGGNNAESHNHNDVGNFLLFCDGTPVLVDAGVETYTKFTFSDKRYSLWAMQSCYHNVPTVNGADEAPGLEYHAKEVSLSGTNGEPVSASTPASPLRLSMEIGAAYPHSAGIISYKRDFIFIPNVSLELTDTYSLTNCDEPLILNLLCYEKPVISGSAIELSGKIVMNFDSGVYSPKIETIELTDPKIHNDWQKEHLYRLRLVKKVKDLSGILVLKFTRKP